MNVSDSEFAEICGVPLSSAVVGTGHPLVGSAARLNALRFSVSRGIIAR